VKPQLNGLPVGVFRTPLSDPRLGMFGNKVLRYWLANLPQDGTESRLRFGANGGTALF